MSQLQSPLVSLPGELRNEIFRLALASDMPLTNPSFESSIRPKHQQVPPLGTALSRSCRKIHNELDLTPLFEHNTFVFTRVAHIHAFYSNLSRSQMRLIRSITIDLREAVSSHASNGQEKGDMIGNEWLHYLACNQYAHAPGLWCSSLSTMSSDIPDIKELTVDMTGWQSPFAGMRKSGWKYLQRLLGSLKHMDSITLKGRCLDASCWNPNPAPWGVGPWFSPAFSNDNISLLELLGSGVREPSSGAQKVFAWDVQDGVTTLSVRILSKLESSLVQVDFDGKAPQTGVGSWDTFLAFKVKKEMEASDIVLLTGYSPSTDSWDVLPVTTSVA